MSLQLIKCIIGKKGGHQWYRENGKLIINGALAKATRKAAVKIIKKKFYSKTHNHKWKTIAYTEIDTNFEDGSVEMEAKVYNVVDVLGKISLQLKKSESSLIRIRYDAKALKKFKISDMKSLAMLAMGETHVFDPLETYEYKTVKKLF